MKLPERNYSILSGWTAESGDSDGTLAGFKSIWRDAGRDMAVGSGYAFSSEEEQRL